MTELTLAHTSLIEAPALERLRLLVVEAFGGGFDEHDWDHALGGVHCVVWEGDRPVAHAAVVSRQLTQRGRAVRAGYVEGVAVAAAHRREGLGHAVMEAAEGVIAAAYPAGALSSSEEGLSLYESRGWMAWEGPLAVLAPDGPRPTPDDSVHVLDPDGIWDRSADLACDWRAGDVW